MSESTAQNKKCPYCGQVFPANVRVCPECKKIVMGGGSQVTVDFGRK